LEGNEMDQVTQTAIQTAEALAPALLAAAASSNPNTAAVVALAPVAMQFLQSAIQLQNAGALSPDQLAYLFASTGQGIQDTHNKWKALDAATPVPAVA
jgi:hypothetical protein